MTEVVQTGGIRPMRIMGVLGGSGGVGASTLATALALRAGEGGCSVGLVDAHPCGAGLDVLLSLDSTPGVRWPDMSHARGSIDGAALWSRLPRHGSCRVLSWDRSPGAALPTRGPDIVVALAQRADLMVLDLPPGSDGASWWELCQGIVVILGSGVRQIAAAAATLEALAANETADSPPEIAGVLRVLRRGGPDRDDVGALVGLPMVGTIGDDPTIESALTRGDVVGLSRGPVKRAAQDVLAHLLTTPGLSA